MSNKTWRILIGSLLVFGCIVSLLAAWVLTYNYFSSALLTATILYTIIFLAVELGMVTSGVISGFVGVYILKNWQLPTQTG